MYNCRFLSSKIEVDKFIVLCQQNSRTSGKLMFNKSSDEMFVLLEYFNNMNVIQ